MSSGAVSGLGAALDGSRREGGERLPSGPASLSQIPVLRVLKDAALRAGLARFPPPPLRCSRIRDLRGGPVSGLRRGWGGLLPLQGKEVSCWVSSPWQHRGGALPARPLFTPCSRPQPGECPRLETKPSGLRTRAPRWGLISFFFFLLGLPLVLFPARERWGRGETSILGLQKPALSSPTHHFPAPR